jgi:bifunctional UDP-N-acetylglucosamine pyrophosphorylase/glucosamine-1-phosphate N-acetyltransferase
MATGIIIVDPEHTYIEPAVKVGLGTEILPGTHLRGKTVIGARCTIGPDCYIEASTIQDDCVVRYSVIEEALVRRGSTIGPYAHLRPQADIGPEARIGNFVEVKASRIGQGVKVGHLSYIGDADVGEYSNIGAGTITCNYDGKQKHHTKIGKRAFIGSNTALVAPINIGDDAFIGAGSTITENVPDGELALGRARQQNKQRKDQREDKAQ